jgi:small-conductance mechanosensitive channel
MTEPTRDEPTRPEKTQRTTTQSTILEERPPAYPVRRDVTPPPRRRWRWLRLVFRRPMLAALVAIAALVASYQFGGVLGGHHRVLDEGVAVGNAVVFLGSAVVAVRGATDDLLHRVPRRIGDARISALRLMCLFFGYILIGIAALSLLRVPVAHLLLGGVLTGVILGIAAQQSLGNTFAGLVLLFARPFSVGSPVTIRSGALGGSITGTVTGMSLTYVTLRTERGTVLLPNTAVLASAIGPDAEWQG